jgi:hypothetical protein
MSIQALLDDLAGPRAAVPRLRQEPAREDCQRSGEPVRQFIVLLAHASGGGRLRRCAGAAMMCRMDTLHTAFPESGSVAWLETTIRRGRLIRKTLRPSAADIQTLFALRKHQNMGELDHSLERLQALGCITWDNDEYPALTLRGLDVLRRRLT